MQLIWKSLDCDFILSSCCAKVAEGTRGGPARTLALQSEGRKRMLLYHKFTTEQVCDNTHYF